MNPPRHTNNAAEWVLWALLLPALVVVWVRDKLICKRQAGHANRQAGLSELR